MSSWFQQKAKVKLLQDDVILYQERNDNEIFNMNEKIFENVKFIFLPKERISSRNICYMKNTDTVAFTCFYMGSRKSLFALCRTF